MRTQLLGYDLGDQQRVAIVDYPSTVPQDRAFHAVRQAAQNVGARPLLGSRREAVVALSEASLSWTSLRTAIDAELGHVSCRIGIGGICQGAPDVPRSYPEAQLVLQLMAYGASGASVAFFDELGVFQILAEAQDPNTVHRFVRKWLGALLDYTEAGTRTSSPHSPRTSKQVATTPTRPGYSTCTATRFATG